MSLQLSQYIELLLGSVGVILGLFFAIFLLLVGREYRHANALLSIYLLAFSLRIGKSLFHNFFDIDEWIRTTLLATLLAIGPATWLYVKSLVKAEESIDKGEYFHFLPLTFAICLSWLIPNDGTSWLFAVFYNFLIAHMFGYMLVSIVWLKAQSSKYDSEIQSNTRGWLYSFLTINLVFVVFYFLISESVIAYMTMSLLFTAVIISFSFLALRDLSLFQKPYERYSGSQLDEVGSQNIMNRLRAVMEQEKPYLNPSLNLEGLSEMVGTSTKELSQAINQLESLNYSQFIAKHRVIEVQRILREGNHANFKIAAIAYQCGFNSISSFNAAFKKHTGTTAAAYKSSLKR